MNFLRGHIKGFGGLSDLTLVFKDGLNLVFAPNEAGKTTLQRFLTAMLYGQLRPDLKSQRRLEPWVENYRPWNGSEYGGAIWCKLVNGSELEIRRAFGREEARVQIYRSSGEDITGEYEFQRNGEVLFGRTHFGLPKELFESVAVIHENLVSDLHGRDTIRDRIANLAQSGDEELSVRHSLARLEETLESIGSDRAPTRPYKQALDRLASLREERRLLEARRLEFVSWIEERSRLGAEVVRLEGDIQTAQSDLLTARVRETADRLHQLEELDKEVRDVQQQIESNPGQKDFPAHNLEDLNELVGAVESVNGRITENRNMLEAAQTRVRRAQAELEAMAPYLDLLKDADTDKVTEWFVKYLNTSVHRDSALRSSSQLREDINDQLRQLEQVGVAFQDPSIDWQRRALEAAEFERRGSSEAVEYSEKITRQKSTLLSAQGRSTRYRVLGLLALLGMVALLASWRVWGIQRIPWVVPASASAILGVAAMLSFLAAGGATREKETGARTLTALESAQARLLEESRVPRQQIEKAMTDAGYESVEDFLAAARQAEQSRQRIADLELRAEEAEQQKDKLAAECTELYTRLQDLLCRAGLSCSPATLKSRVDLFRASLKESRVRDAAYRDCLLETEALRAQADQIAADLEEKNARIQSILREAGVETVEEFRAACRHRLQLMELVEREASRSRELQRLSGSRTLDQWRLDLSELEQLREKIPRPDPRVDAGNGNPGTLFLPYAPDAAEAEQKEKKIRTLLSNAREEHARVVERVVQAFRNYRPLSEIEEDLAITEQAVRECERNRGALEIAAESIRILSREQQEVLAPQLNLAVEQRFLRLSQSRYREVKIDPDFEVRVREASTGELRRSASLSRGTQDQLYFALRFGILDLVSNSEEPCPSLLDEPFAAYDRSRMNEGFAILRDEAACRQLVLFTCREDLRDLGLAQGAHLLQLNPVSL